jgi:hypothetical protein
MCLLGDEGSRATVADEGVLVENQTHLEIEPAGNVLIEQGHDDTVATKTSELRVGPLPFALRPRFSIVLRTPCHFFGLPTSSAPGTTAWQPAETRHPYLWIYCIKYSALMFIASTPALTRRDTKTLQGQSGWETMALRISAGRSRKMDSNKNGGRGRHFPHSQIAGAQAVLTQTALTLRYSSTCCLPDSRP